MSTPSVSVLMPVYNAGRYLRPAVESVLAQTYRDFEFLIVEDGSTDRSPAILRKYARADARIRLLTHADNRGYVARLTEGLALAQGEFIARMDADDVAMPDRLERQVAFLRDHPEVVCVGGGIELIDPKGRTLIRFPMRQGNQQVQQAALEGDTPIYHPAAMMRAAAVRAAGGYDETRYPAEDLDLWLRLGEIGELDNVPGVVLRYRVHSGSVSSRHQELQVRSKRVACEAACQRRGVTAPFRGVLFRPVNRQSRYETALKYGWWLFDSGQWLAALEYGVRCVLTLPQREQDARLLACAILKRPRRNVPA